MERVEWAMRVMVIGAVAGRWIEEVRLEVKRSKVDVSDAMMRMRNTQTRMATKTGITRVRVVVLITAELCRA